MPSGGTILPLVTIPFWNVTCVVRIMSRNHVFDARCS